MNSTSLTRKKPKPPAHLRPETQKWWRSVVSGWVLDAHHLNLLLLACEALDRAEECREAIEKEGVTIQGLHGPKQHPLLPAERDARLSYVRILKALNLDEDDGNGRPGRGRK